MVMLLYGRREASDECRLVAALAGAARDSADPVRPVEAAFIEWISGKDTSQPAGSNPFLSAFSRREGTARELRAGANEDPDRVLRKHEMRSE